MTVDLWIRDEQGRPVAPIADNVPPPARPAGPWDTNKG